MTDASNSRSFYYKVGLFVSLGLVALMISILALGGKQQFLTSYTHLRARFNQTQGLFVGSVVSLSGVVVGNVSRIDFVDINESGSNSTTASANIRSALEIEMAIDQRFAPRLHEGMIAEIRTQGALGDKFIYLTPGPNSAPLMPNNSLVTSNEDEDFLKMLTSKQDGVGRFLDVAKEAQILLATLNTQNRVGNSLQNLQEITTTLKSSMQRLDQLIQHIDRQLPEGREVKNAAIHLANILEKIDRGQGTLGALINDPSLHQSLKGFLGNSPRNRYLKEVVRESIQQSERTSSESATSTNKSK